MPRPFPRSALVAGLAVAMLVASLASPAAAAPRERLVELQLDLNQIQVQAQMGTAFWLAMQGRVKGIQARMQHDRRELRTAGADARALRADLREQERQLEPLLPTWLAVKALLHRSYEHVKTTLAQVRRMLVERVGPEPGRNGASAWLEVFRRPPGEGRSGLEVCPVDGPFFMVDTFGAPRPGGRFHEGDDMQTARGTPILAVLPGIVRRVPNELGGNAAIVDSAGGTYTYYAHMSAYGASGPVEAGTVIGYAGATGNAKGLIPHLHFELHPGGGDAVDAFADLQAAC